MAFNTRLAPIYYLQFSVCWLMTFVQVLVVCQKSRAELIHLMPIVTLWMCFHILTQSLHVNGKTLRRINQAEREMKAWARANTDPS